MPLVLLLALALSGAWPALARADDWLRPVGGEVVEAFAYDRAAPFARDQHRGVDLSARAGEAVRSPCAGVVTFAGQVPGRGRGVSIRCGALVATLVELGGVRVDHGRRVGRGEPVGRAGGAVHVGARRVGDGFAYVDPARLFARPASPLGPAPPVRRRGPRTPLPAATPRPATPRFEATPRLAAPPAAWAGLALAVAGLPVGSVVRRRRRGVGRGARRVLAPR